MVLDKAPAALYTALTTVRLNSHPWPRVAEKRPPWNRWASLLPAPAASQQWLQPVIISSEAALCGNEEPEPDVDLLPPNQEGKDHPC